jgi:hypothetical protein
MKQNLVLYLAGLVISLIACNSSDLLTIGVRPTPTPTFIPASYATATATSLPTPTPTAKPAELASPTLVPTGHASPTVGAGADEVETRPGPTPAATATPTALPLPPSVSPASPTATIPPAPAPLAGRIAFPVDDGGGFYDVWVVELPAGEPFLVQPRARQPNFSEDGRLLVKTQGSDLGESIGLLDANYVWQGIVNESPEDSYPFWQPEGSRYTYSNSNLVKDPDTAHLAPFIFTTCSLQIPRFENSEKCQDTRRWGKIEVGEAPIWTKDDRIAYFTYKGDDGIYFVESASVLREAGGLAPSQLLVRSNGRPTDTAGFQLFFSAGDIDGNWEAYAIDLDGTNLTNLSNSPLAQDGLPTVSPDGNWVAFVSDRDGRWGIWVVPRTGGEPMKVADISKINTNPNPWGTGDRAWMMERISWGP